MWMAQCDQTHPIEGGYRIANLLGVLRILSLGQSVKDHVATERRSYAVGLARVGGGFASGSRRSPSSHPGAGALSRPAPADQHAQIPIAITANRSNVRTTASSS